MQDITSGHRQVQVSGSTVRQVIENLERAHPGMKARLVENDRIRPSISVAVDGEVTPIGMLEKVGENSEVHFIPAIAGGTLYWRVIGCHSEELVARLPANKESEAPYPGKDMCDYP